MNRPVDRARAGDDPAALVVWRSLGRRFARLAVAGVIAALVVLVGVLVSGGSPASAVGLALATLAAVVLIAGIGLVATSAFQGMLRAGERGERLAGDDVGLVPPRAHPLRAGDPDEGETGDG